MYVYLLNMFIDGRFTFAGIFKEQPTFYSILHARLSEILPNEDFQTIICSDGVVVESEDLLDNFEGTTFTVTVNMVELEFRVRDRHWFY